MLSSFLHSKNEALNRKATATAPKDRFYGGSSTLTDRLRMVAIVDSIGYEEGTRRVMEKLGIQMYESVNVWAKRKDREKQWRKVHSNKPEIKWKRSKKKRESRNNELKISKRKANETATYGTGIGFNVQTDEQETNTNPIRNECTQENNQNKKQKILCDCGSGIDHYRTTHKSCLKNKKNRKNKKSKNNKNNKND